MRRPISGLEYNNLRRENRGNNLRGRAGAPLQPPTPFSFSLNIFEERSIGKRYALLEREVVIVCFVMFRMNTF